MRYGRYEIVSGANYAEFAREKRDAYLQFAKSHGLNGVLHTCLNRRQNTISFGLVNVDKFLHDVKLQKHHRINVDLHDHSMYPNSDVDLMIGNHKNILRSKMSVVNLDFNLNAFVEKQKSLLIGQDYLLSLQMSADNSVTVHVAKHKDFIMYDDGTVPEKEVYMLRQLPDVNLSQYGKTIDFEFD